MNLTKYMDVLSRAGLPEASSVLGVACITFLTLMPAQAGQVPVSVFNLLRVGMSEAQVLACAGPPDVDTSIGADIYETETLIVDPQDESSVLGAARYKTVYEVKELHHLPGPSQHDPLLTVVTIKAETVATLTRTKIFTRITTSVTDNDQQSATPTSDFERMINQLNRTIAVAEQYAVTRARLKQESGNRASSVSARPAELFRALLSDGSVSFGDRPSGV